MDPGIRIDRGYDPALLYFVRIRRPAVSASPARVSIAPKRTDPGE
jgi:hypothetical protein